jgi:hypothetical protein
MFKPRFLMTHRQKEVLDARMGELDIFRGIIASMTTTQRAKMVQDMAGEIHHQAGQAVLDGISFLACLIACLASMANALASHSTLSIAVAVLLLPVSYRTLNTYGLQRDTYFGMVRRRRELTAPPEPSRFHD